jgi:putative PIN family toxin of toxin-antitoxin system
MKVLLDTNVLVAAFIAHGTCHEVLEQCIYHHEIVGSSVLLNEFRRTLEKLGYTRQEAREAEALLASRMILVTAAPLGSRVCRDPDDDMILGTALAGACECIVSGDKDLLILKKYRGVDIVSPTDFWRYQEE